MEYHCIATTVCLGFLDGWYMDEKCLARQSDIKGSSLPLENIKHYPDIPQAIDALKSGVVSDHSLRDID